MQIDWELLRTEALTAMKKAYVPYSKFPVGVAALVDDGRIVTGCNVENASYGLTLCAECGLVSSLIASGGGRLIAFACVDISGNALMPCGRCRQLLQEHGGSKLQLMTDEGVKTLNELLPWAFGPEEIDTRISNAISD
jgi:cytidine deaminase